MTIDWTPAQIKAIMDDKIAAERERRDELRRDDRRVFDEYKESQEKALVLQAAEYKRSFEAYPTLRDFNGLTKLVDVELAGRAGASKGLILFLSIAATISSVLSVLLLFLRYMGP